MGQLWKFVNVDKRKCGYEGEKLLEMLWNNSASCLINLLTVHTLQEVKPSSAGLALSKNRQ